MARINRLNYAFGVGKIRAKETKLLMKKEFLTMLDLELKDALTMIVEKSDYPQELIRIKNSSDLEDILDYQLKQTLSLVSSLLINKELIEPILSWEKFGDSLILADMLKFNFLISYIRTFSDLLNIKLFFRFKNLNKQKKELSSVLLDTGYIKKDIYLEVFDTTWEDFQEGFSQIRYGLLIKESYAYFKENNSFLKLDMLIEDFLINFIRQAKYICLGPEAILAYYLAKENEVNLIRLIISAKLNSLPRENIIARLNNTYV